MNISSEDQSIYSAITDWLNCTFPCSGKPEALREFFMQLFSAFGHRFAPAVETGRGLHGYDRSFSLGDSGGFFAIGNGTQRGTALLSLPGEACSLLTDWQSVVDFLAVHLKGRITRWDGAVDDFVGTHSMEMAVEFYKAGLFSTGGNKPCIDQKGNWLEPDGRGRTLNIGKRKNGKMVRIYEKGQQLGVLWDPWVRWELELHNRHREVPWDVLLRPGHYFVGAYPKALQWAQNEMIRVRTIQKQATLSYKHLAECAKKAYGPLLNLMQEVEGSPEEAFKKLVRHGYPKRMIHPYANSPADLIDRDDEDGLPGIITL